MSSVAPLNPSEEAKAAPSLRYSVRDGIGAAVMMGSGESYLGAYGIFLKASELQIGSLAALPPLLGALFQGLSVWLVERYHKRKAFFTWGAAAQAFFWLPIAVLPFFLTDPFLRVAALIALACMYYCVSGLIGPMWASLIGDLVPASIRGRYFGERSKYCGFASFIALVCAGQILDSSKNWGLALNGFVVIFVIASLARFYSVYWIHRHYEPPYAADPKGRFTFFQFVMRTPKSNFAKFVLYIATTNFAVNFAGPYFAVYMLRELHFSYLQYTAISASAVVAQFLTLQHWGNLTDRFGNKKILNVCCFGIALNPILWLFSTDIAYLLLVQVFSGFVWAGFNLAAGNFLFDAVTPPKRARCAAYQAIVNGVFTFGGAFIGGLYATHAAGWSVLSHIPLFPQSVFFQLFLISGLLRLAAAYVVLPSVFEVRPVEEVKHHKLIFQITNIRPFTGATFRLIFGSGNAKKEETEEG